MKLSKYVMAGILALTITSSTYAQTPIYITGSTAFRGATVNGISGILSGTVSIAYDGLTSGVTGPANANAVTWTGGNIGGTAVTIKASWSGSAAGVQTVAGAPNFNVRFLPDGASGGNNADPRNPANPADPEVPDVAMSDVFQAATPFTGTCNGVTYAGLNDTSVGVVTFVFAASSGFPIGGGAGTSSSYSMTPQLAQNLYPGGLVPLSMITGLVADNNTGVIATGRDFDSGTRLTTMAETNVGISTGPCGIGTLLHQWKPTISGGSVTALALYPRTTINGVDTQVPGNSGESSGSSLRGFLTNTVSVAAAHQVDPTLTGGFLMTYLGVSDYNNVSATAVKMRYAGNDFSQLAVEQGQYTFWGYEHLDYKVLGGVKLTFATNLANHILGETSATLNPNVAISDMAVQRFADGGPVSSLLH
jgi:hypothetical protein